MKTMQVRNTIVCLWLIFAITALLACAVANGWMMYTAAETVLPKQVIAKTVTMWAHELKVAALAVAMIFVGVEIFVGGVAEQAYAAADAEGFVSARALRLVIVVVLLVVLIAVLELGIVHQRALALQLELDRIRPNLTAYEIHVREDDIARTRVLFTMITVATFLLTTLLSSIVLRGFRTIAPAIGGIVHRVGQTIGTAVAAVWSAVVFVLGVCVAFLLEIAMFAVAAVIAIVWGIVLAAGTVAMWATEVVDLFLERIIRRPWRALVAFWHQFWTPVVIESTAPPPEAHPEEDPPPATPTVDVGNGTTDPSAIGAIEYTSAPASATIELGTNGTARPCAQIRTRRPSHEPNHRKVRHRNGRARRHRRHRAHGSKGTLRV